MALVFDDIVRFTVVGSQQGQDLINILDMKIEATGVPGDSREEQIEATAGDLLNQWTDHILPVLCSTYSAQEVRYVDLNTLAGVTGSVSSTGENAWPLSGDITTAPCSNNVYAKMIKNLDSHTRQARNGALRFGGIPEAYTSDSNGNNIMDTPRAQLNSAFEDLKDGMNGSGVSGWTKNLGVLHTVDRVAVGFTFIAEFSCALTVGTIRRRMPGYGS